MQERKQNPQNQDQEQDYATKRRGAAGQDATPEASAQGSEETDENAATEDDGSPVLDEQDLQENNLTDEEADNVEWDPEDKERNRQRQ